MLSLTEEQKLVVHHKDGPLLVISSAGSGKTFCVTERVKHLITHHGVNPKEILCITFTNKAAEEMKERISSSTGISDSQLQIFTFHGFCNTWLRKQGGSIGYHNYKIMDADEVKHLVTSIATNNQLGGKCKRDWLRMQTITPKTNYAELEAKYLDHENKTLKNKKVRMVQDLLQKITKGNLSLNLAAKTLGSDQDSQKYLLDCATQYMAKKKAMNLFDFDDLESKGLELFKSQPIYSNYKYVILDESQDLSPIELDIAKAVCPSGNIMAVGDGMQCQPGDTIIETTSGPKLLKDIVPGDEVYTSNPKTLRIEEKPVNYIQKRWYKGKLYKVSTDTEFTRCSSTHSFLVHTSAHINKETIKLPIDEVDPNDAKLPVLKTTKRGPTIQFKDITVTIQDFEGWLYSMDVADNHTYIADGIITCNSIYGFRGSSSTVLDEFCSMFQAKRCYLSINFRCDKNIVELANITTKGHRDVEPTSSSPNPGYVGYVEFANPTKEIEWITKSIKSMVNGKT